MLLFNKACCYSIYLSLFLFFILADIVEHYRWWIIPVRKIFSYLLSFSLTCSFFSFFLFLFFISCFFLCWFYYYYYYYFFDDVPKWRTLHGSRISNIIDSNDINTNTTIQTKMYALYKWQLKQQKQTLVSQVKT